MVYSYLILFLILTTGVLSQWEKCLQCHCYPYNDYWRAICDRDIINTEINEIPSIHKPEVKELSLNFQPIRILPDKVFFEVDLVNLIYLFLMQCHISRIDEEAFFGLENLVELDISFNKIIFLGRNTFSPLTNLKRLKIEGNNLGSIGNGLLLSLSSLEMIDLSSNKLTRLNNNVFPNSKTLTCINVSKNNITYMNVSTIEHLKLRSLQLHENPWICDCQLRSLQEIIKKKSIADTEVPKCTFPSYVMDKKWMDMQSEEFNCWLYIIYPGQYSEIPIQSENVTLPCMYTGSPFGKVKWSFRNHTIIASAKYKFSFKQIDHVTYWYNLTIAKVGYEDKGEYKCSVVNLAGVQELVVKLGTNIGYSEFSYINKWAVLVSVTCIIFIGSVVVIFIKCFVRYSAITNMEHGNHFINLKKYNIFTKYICINFKIT